MAGKSLFTVLGYRGDGESYYAIANKGMWNSPTSVSDPAFVLSDRLDGNNGMPISRPTLDDPLAPYVFSFINEKAAAPQFRNALTSYTYSLKLTGSSKVWMYDSTNGWGQKPNPSGTDPFFAFNPPYNFYSIGNIDFNGDNFLVAADYDSTNNAGGTLALLSMSVDSETGAESYGVVTTLSGPPDFPRKVVGDYTYQAHVQDALVLGPRIIVDVNYMAVTDDPTVIVPPEYMYIRGEIREYALELSGGKPTFSLVDTLGNSKNSVHLLHHQVDSVDYIFSANIGGYQNEDVGNGADSSISIFKLANTGFDHDAGFDGTGEMRALVGVPGSYVYPDFRGIAIASNGTAYFLCGNYTSNNGMTFVVYQTTAEHLVSNGETGNTSYDPPVPYTIPTDYDLGRPYIQRQTATSAYYWALAIVVGPDGSEHLLFAKGSVNAPMDFVGHDVLSFVPVGEPWINSHTIGHHTVGTEINEFTGLTDSLGFTINSLDISVPGGVVHMKPAPAPFARVSGATGTRDAEQDELVKNAKAVAATYKR